MPGYITRRLWNFKRQISEGDERIRWKGTTCSAQLVICILQVPALLEKTCRCWLTRNSMFWLPHCLETTHTATNVGMPGLSTAISLSLSGSPSRLLFSGRPQVINDPKDDNLYLIFEGLPGCQLMDWSERSCTYSARPSVNLRLGLRSQSDVLKCRDLGRPVWGVGSEGFYNPFPGIDLGKPPSD